MTYVSVLGPDPIRFGMGEYCLSESFTRSLIARECFLDAMVLIEPRAFRTLVTPNGMALARSARDMDALPCYATEPHQHGRTMIILGGPGALTGYLDAWKRQWNIPDLWVDILAADTLVHAADCLARKEPLPTQFVTYRAAKAAGAGNAGDTDDLPVTPPIVSALPRLDCVDDEGRPVPIWRPYFEPRAPVKHHLMAMFEVALDRLMDSMEDRCTRDPYMPDIGQAPSRAFRLAGALPGARQELRRHPERLGAFRLPPGDRQGDQGDSRSCRVDAAGTEQGGCAAATTGVDPTIVNQALAGTRLTIHLTNSRLEPIQQFSTSLI
jgi:hypothetical protein